MGNWSRILNWGVLLTCAAMFILSMLTLPQVPRYFVDEVLSLSRVESLLESGSAVGWLDYNPFINRYLPPTKVMELPYYLFAAPSVFLNIEPEIFQFRIVVFLFSILLLYAGYQIAASMHGARAGMMVLLYSLTSSVFLFSSHMARPDVIAIALSYFALYLLLFRTPANLAGLIFAAFAFLMHERSVIVTAPAVFFFVLSSLTRERFKKALVAFSVFFVLILSALLFAGQAYLTAWISYYRAIWEAAAIPLASGKFASIFANINHVFSGISKIEAPLFWIIVPFALLAFMQQFIGRGSKMNLQALALLTIILLGIFLVDMPLPIKLLYYFPVFYIVLAVQTERLLRVMENPRPRSRLFYKCALLIVFSHALLGAVFPVGVLASFKTADCAAEQPELREKLLPVIGDRNRVIGEESYYLTIGKRLTASWKHVKYYAIQNGMTFSEAVKDLGVQAIIFDTSTTPFILEERSKVPYIEAFRLDKEDLKRLTAAPGVATGALRSSCYGPITLIILDHGNSGVK